MRNLMEEIDLKLKEVGLEPISNVVDNKKYCIRYINKILRKYGNKVTIPFQLTLSQYDFRVKHVLFSFGLGIVFANFYNLKTKIEEEYRHFEIDNTFIYVWMTLCLYHDFGYFIGSSYIQTDSIENLHLDYIIFDYDYCKSRYSNNLYVEYYKDKFSKQKRNQKNMAEQEEVGDHGILGGYVLFDRLYSSEVKPISLKKNLMRNIYDLESPHDGLEYHLERIPLYQDICYRIMEHNIWKNKDNFAEDHPFYEIGSKTFKYIDVFEPLLYLLSLVDTIEMTKKFCKYSDDSQEKEHFVFPKTLGSKIKVKISDTSIDIDYLEFEKYIKEHKFFDSIEDWKHSIIGLNDWLCLEAREGKNSKIILTKQITTVI